MRRKLALAAGIVAAVAVTGGAAAGAVTLSTPTAPGQPAITSGVAAPGHGGPSPAAPGHAGAPGHPQRPLLAVVGASFSAGVGAGRPERAWPEDLARIEHWRLALSADPGAGYVNPGSGHRGPFAQLAGRLHLARIDPATIIIQGGHDDIGRPLPLVRRQVESLIGAVHRACPQSRLAVLTVFPRGVPNRATVATDQAIVAAARQADPTVIVFDPIASHWQFPRIGDQLHPTPAGHEWIARQLAAGLHDRTPVRATHLAGRATRRAGGAVPGNQLNALPHLG